MKVVVVRKPPPFGQKKKKYEGRGSLQWYYSNIMIMKCVVCEIIFTSSFHISWFALICFTTRKLINTNGNTNGIFLSVNFRGILPTEIFPQYIPTELPWEKILKQSKKKYDVSFLPTKWPTEYSVGKIPRWFRR